MGAIQERDIIAIGDHTSPQRDVLSVLWAITKACQFSCSYCVYYKSPRGAEYSSREQLLRGARTLLRMGRPGYQITLYGGEPTLHPHFNDLLDFFVAAQAPVSLRMYTNGTRSTRFYEEMVARTGRYPFLVIFSLHLEAANFRKFLQAVEITARGGMSVGVSFMFDPARREHARNCLNELLALRAEVPFFISINYPYRRDGGMGQACTPDDVEWVEASRRAFDAIPMPPHLGTPFYTRIASAVDVLRNNRRERLPAAESLPMLARMHTPRYLGFHCCSGTNVLFVEEDGAVRGGVCDRSRHMGNIFRDSAILLTQAMGTVCCGALACNSVENIPLPKFRDAAEAQQCIDAFRDRAKAYLYTAELRRLSGRGVATPRAPS